MRGGCGHRSSKPRAIQHGAPCNTLPLYPPTQCSAAFAPLLSVIPVFENRRPVLVFGEPGLEKDNIAVLIHFSSPQHDRPMVHTCPCRGHARLAAAACDTAPEAEPLYHTVCDGNDVAVYGMPVFLDSPCASLPLSAAQP